MGDAVFWDDTAKLATADDDTGNNAEIGLAVTANQEQAMRANILMVAVATLVGLLTGLFGVGGGFAVVPALTLLRKFPAKEAIGTALVVIVGMIRAS